MSRTTLIIAGTPPAPDTIATSTPVRMGRDVEVLYLEAGTAVVLDVVPKEATA